MRVSDSRPDSLAGGRDRHQDHKKLGRVSEWPTAGYCNVERTHPTLGGITPQAALVKDLPGNLI